ncbi:WD40-repeat-containing domain protein [Suillus fuscotomentosus]|uniref:WD40-repeat-containing domain protein n=1 Tax=Suillus fuscotomentosus TaxID=1912939 RepID=A0AAD4HNE0_9AGAM|nr:WD40-repeat-containing domain protein [Suillus fuscotomentosus]KAG1901619.1 WD40-repeat-containing domain protein [Suillus fuscotomentosus]
MSELSTITTPLRWFEGHEGHINAVAVFPDKYRMVTGSYDTTLHLWDLKTGVVLKKMVGHRNPVWRLAISRDGQLIASGDERGEVIVCAGCTRGWRSESKQTLKTVVNMGIFIPPKMIFDCFGHLAQPPALWHMILGVIRVRHYLWKRINIFNTLTWVGNPRKGC